MSSLSIQRLLVCLAISASVIPAARAQWAVIDVPAIAQLVQEVQTMQQQLTTAQDHLQQAKQTWQSMTGSRGMEQLLSGTVRNYLPSDWTQLTQVLQSASGRYSGLSNDVRDALAAIAVLPATRLAAMAPPEKQQIEAVRQWAATQTALSRQALAATSGRFASIQRLIDAIPAAADQKAILDLQARIGAEQNMLQNEQTKLQVIQQAGRAQEAANLQQLRELAIAGHGRFETRFQPTP